MRKLLKTLLIATASVGAIAGTTAAVVSCGNADESIDMPIPDNAGIALQNDTNSATTVNFWVQATSQKLNIDAQYIELISQTQTWKWMLIDYNHMQSAFWKFNPHSDSWIFFEV